MISIHKFKNTLTGPVANELIVVEAVIIVALLSSAAAARGKKIHGV